MLTYQQRCSVAFIYLRSIWQAVHMNVICNLCSKIVSLKSLSPLRSRWIQMGWINHHMREHHFLWSALNLLTYNFHVLWRFTTSWDTETHVNIRTRTSPLAQITAWHHRGIILSTLTNFDLRPTGAFWTTLLWFLTRVNKLSFQKMQLKWDMLKLKSFFSSPNITIRLTAWRITHV